MRKNIKQFLLSITVMSTTQIGFAQQQDTLKIFPFKEIIVTATRIEKNGADVGRSITIITSDHIKNSIYNSVAELLSQQEGIYIVGTGQNPGMIQSIFTRGANSNQTLIMLDGVRITDPSTPNNAPDLSELSLANVEKIEIVRGPHSTLYGSSAIGGVINIITKKGTMPGFNVDVEVKAGTFGNGTSAFSENVFLNYTTQAGFYINAEIYNANIKGLDATIDTVTNPNVYNIRDKDGLDKRDLIGKIGFKNDKFDVFASYKKTDQRKDIDKRAYIDDDNYTLDFNRNLFTHGASYKINDRLNLKYIGGLSDMTRVAVDDSSAVDDLGNNDHTYFDATYKGSISTNEIQGNLKGKGLDMVFGGGLYNETMTFKTYYINTAWAYESMSDLDTLDLNISTNNIFVHIDLNGILVNEKFNRFSLALGGRLINHSTFGSNPTYEINPSFKVNDNALIYASYSTGFNVPSLYQLFSPNKNFTSGIARGNKNLKPETSASYEFGFKQKITDNLSFTVAYFNTEVNNAIEYVYLWNKNTPVDLLSWSDYHGDTYLNLGQQSNRGIEFSINSKMSNNLYLAGNFSLISGKLNYGPSDINSSQTEGNHVQIFGNGTFLNKEVEVLGLVRRPNTANINLTYKPFKKLALRLDLKHIGSRNDIFYNSQLGPYGALGIKGVSDYSLLDFSAKYDFNNHFSTGMRVGNIFDTKYREINGFTTRGRGVYFNLRYLI
ncbi:TonB-dependent receptor [Caldithrix abyssi]|nr:TonB-dependent receptor [Caldithrix abyssi]